MSSMLTPFITVLQTALDCFYAVTQDWGAAIVLLTLSIRLLLFFVNIPAARQQVIQSKIHSKMQELKAKYQQDARKPSEEIIKLYQEYGYKPLSMMVTSLLQIPILMSLYRLFQDQGAAMTSIMLPWTKSLGDADHLLQHLLPCALASTGCVIAVLDDHCGSCTC